MTVKKTKTTLVVKMPTKLQVQSQASQSSQKKKKKKILMKNSSALSAAECLSSEGGYESEKMSHAKLVTETMNSNKEISLAGKSSLHTILNPCGENGANENAKFPDGTLSQSGVQRLRQFETIVTPWQSSSVTTNTTNNWSLYIISPGCYRTIGLLVAVRDGRALNDMDFSEIFSLINASDSPAAYPVWAPFGDSASDPPPNIYYSVYSFKAADLNIDANTGESRNIESFRVVGDGMVVMHNTPDLWNQGSFAVGQFQTDFVNAETDISMQPINVSFIYLGPGTVANSISVNITIYAVDSAGSTVVLANAINTAVLNSTNYTISTSAADVAYQVLQNSPDNRIFINHVNGTQDDLTYRVSWTTLPNFEFEMTPTTFSDGNNVTIFGNAVGNYIHILGGQGFRFSREAGFGASPVTQVIWTVPPLNQDSIAQADPKFSAELMKQHNGLYVARRYFQPVLQMTKSNSGGPLKFLLEGMNRQDVINSGGG